MIAEAQVMIALQPWLGPGLLGLLSPVIRDITGRLNAYSSRREPDELQDALDSLLFFAVRDATRGSMLIQLPDETLIRIRVEDFSVMADDLMLLIFEKFPVDQRHLLLLREYSMRKPSLAALRVLYTRFASLQTCQELTAIASVARSCHPAFRLRGWLDE
ncbi:MAG: hypothetical protein IJE17_03560 [Clostridia bacterium]|nr:hypothetical protein [Clostridia bacterium]MBQ6805610.1 hypothetical protein [Clostridia bacterium]